MSGRTVEASSGDAVGVIEVLTDRDVFIGSLNIEQVSSTSSMKLAIECRAGSGEEVMEAIRDRMSDIAFWIENHYDIQVGESDKE